jgi:hypothetical protein
MDSRINLCPEAGDYQTPLMQHVRLANHKDDPNVLMIEFLAISESPDHSSHQLSIAVPIPKLQATGLLRSLKILQERGLLIPFVPEATPTKN